MVQETWRKLLLYATALAMPPLFVWQFTRFDAVGVGMFGAWAGVVAAMACTVRIVRDANVKGWKAVLMYVGVGLALCALSLASIYISFYSGLVSTDLY